jgi:predicted PurR-regulated permease PerM
VSTTALGDAMRPPSRIEVVAPASTWDLTRILFAVVGIGGLIASSFWVLQPFLPAIVWATTIVVATWPTLLALQRRLWGKRSLAVIVMTLILLAVLAVPLTLGVIAVVERADDVVTWSRGFLKRPLPDLPDWITSLPVVGKKIAAEWQQIASAPSEELASLVAPYVRDAGRWVIARAGSAGTLILQFLLTVGVCAVLYARGETAARGTLAFAVRLAGTHGVRAVLLSAGAIRAVALGIVVTAVVQAVFGGIGLLVAGVPHAILLSCVMLVLGVAQLGPLPVLLGAVIWLFVSGHTVWGSVMIVWALLTTSFDPDQKGRRSAAAPHHRRCHRRLARIRPHRPLRRSRDPRGCLHARRGLGARRRGAAGGTKRRDQPLSADIARAGGHMSRTFVWRER